MKNGRCVLFLHQSADLYGSDRVLLALLIGLKNRKYNPVLLLPCVGPLTIELDKADIEYHIVPLLRVSRATFSFKGIIGLPFRLISSLHAIDRVTGGRVIDLVHSNTLAVVSGAIWAKLHGVTHVWHVHEIIERPVAVRKMFAFLLRVFSDKVICNSYATAKHLYSDQPKLSLKSNVVWNGINSGYYTGIETDAENIRRDIGLKDGRVLVVLVGRINRWKGQRLLIKAANILHERGYNNVHYLLVGDAPSKQHHFMVELKDDISGSPVESNITIMSFVQNIWPIWYASDIAVVPSTEPEPFGMVALEAMISGKPLIAANHGGLTEIVVNNNTGYLFEPGNAHDLADVMGVLLDDVEMRGLFGRNGKSRVEKLFSLKSYISGIKDCYAELRR